MRKAPVKESITLQLLSTSKSKYLNGPKRKQKISISSKINHKAITKGKEQPAKSVSVSGNTASRTWFET
jgi:hypothetical protein